jgi:hypothetical protein
VSNFLLKDPECVLIHIPKTGGSTIRKGIWNSHYDGPEFGGLPDTWQTYFKFAFVRHPLERLVSAWADFSQLRGYTGSIDAFIDIVVDESIIYDERRSNTPERIRHHTIQQTHPFNNLKLADFVGRYESYTDDLAYVLSRVGMKRRSIPSLRKTKHPGWETLIAGRSLKRAIEFYEQDFDELGYPMPKR